MGLYVSHDCWSGGYSSFNSFRNKLAKAAGLPPLMLMEGFYDEREYENPFRINSGYKEENPSKFEQIIDSLPIKWECLKDDPVLILLNHSDCDGEINWEDCERLADRLQEILPKMPEEKYGVLSSWQEVTQKFINGLREAYEQKDNIVFC